MIKKLFPPLSAIILSAAILFGTNVFLKPIASENHESEQHTVMQALLPGSDTFVPEEYIGDDPNITALYRAENGYIVETNVRGYADDITVWVGVAQSGSVTGLTIRKITETPGLGQRALRNSVFLKQYLGSTGSESASDTVDGLSGATVTTKAITKAVNSAAAFLSGADISSGATEWSK